MNQSSKPEMPVVSHQADVCVIGAGMAGICAALAAARHGAKVILVHDRPVFGGNSSSECRIHVCGADRHNSIKGLRETGIIEELRLENLVRNPTRSYSIWDAVLYDMLRNQENLEFILNCSINDANCADGKISSVTGWQCTTYSYQEIEADIFIDTSGDAILAPLVGADYRVGREAGDEFNETIAPEISDDKTMGLTCLFQAAPHDKPMPFEPPAWAHKFTSCDELRGHNWIEMGYWWVELGGETYDTIADTEVLRDELLKITYGVWDHIKNHCKDKEKAANWALEWVQFLPAKRESRRYVGPHVLNQNDVATCGKFDDTVAYGGWTMDDHDPSGFWSISSGKPSTIFHQAPSPYGIPYRSLYSRNISNLMFAGRNASCTHAAMSSSRVMATCGVMGQAAGTAAAIAIQINCTPADISDAHIEKLQQSLLGDDCFLPHTPRIYSDSTMSAIFKTSNEADAEALRDGITRPWPTSPREADNHSSIEQINRNWPHTCGDWLEMHLSSPTEIKTLSMVLDSDLITEIQFSRHQGNYQRTSPPPMLQKDFDIEISPDGENWQLLAEIRGNYQRFVKINVNSAVKALRYRLKSCWSDESDINTNLFAFYVD